MLLSIALALIGSNTVFYFSLAGVLEGYSNTGKGRFVSPAAGSGVLRVPTSRQPARYPIAHRGSRWGMGCPKAGVFVA